MQLSKQIIVREHLKYYVTKLSDDSKREFENTM